jgi:hypothetical protein
MTTRGKGSGKKEDCGEVNAAAAVTAAAAAVAVAAAAAAVAAAAAAVAASAAAAAQHDPLSSDSVQSGCQLIPHHHPCCEQLSCCISRHATFNSKSEPYHALNHTIQHLLLTSLCTLLLLPLLLLLPPIMLLLCSCPKGSLYIQRHGQEVSKGAPHGMTCLPHGMTYLPHGMTYMPHGMTYMPHGMTCMPHGMTYLPHGMTYLPHGMTCLPHGMTCLPTSAEVCPFYPQCSSTSLGHASVL